MIELEIFGPCLIRPCMYRTNVGTDGSWSMHPMDQKLPLLGRREKENVTRRWSQLSTPIEFSRAGYHYCNQWAKGAKVTS